MTTGKLDKIPYVQARITRETRMLARIMMTSSEPTLPRRITQEYSRFRSLKGHSVWASASREEEVLRLETDLSPSNDSLKVFYLRQGGYVFICVSLSVCLLPGLFKNY